jgi:hypothetical protein
MTQDLIFAQDVILDPDTVKVLAVVRNGGVWRDGTKIAVLVGAHMIEGKSAQAERASSCPRSADRSRRESHPACKGALAVARAYSAQ